MKSVSRKILFIFTVLLTFINVVFYFGYQYIIENVGVVSIEELIFHILVPLEGVSHNMIRDIIIQCFVPGIIVSIILIVIILLKFKYYTILSIKVFNLTFKFSIKIFFFFFLFIINILFLVKQFNIADKKFNIKEYISNQMKTSNLIEEEYVNPKEVNIKFEKKRNLIYIYLESMETTYMSTKDGGAQSYDYIPELTKLAKENISFSDKEKQGGAYQLSYTSWTIAGMVSQTAGVPLFVPIDGNTYSGYDTFLPGAYSLGEILKENGYTNELIMGSDSTFAGKRKFFQTHGDYVIKDYYTAKEEGIIEKNHYANWGFEDKYLFEYAKKELLELEKEGKPFNLTLLTSDTHFPDGYTDSSCKLSKQKEYIDALSCSSNKVYSFVEWLKKQSFYNNTTTVIVGDHISMANDKEIFSIAVEDRRVYNVFINSYAKSNNTKNRGFTHMDLYPTILASIGATIEGNKLGLGVNLFSSEETLLEKYGYDYLNGELSKKSTFYNRHILYGD